MNVREKLVELLCKMISPTITVGEQVDFLISNGVTVQKWISVKDMLPKYKDGKVLAFTQYGYTICQRTRNGRWKGQYSNWITDWTYLPPPPETEYGYLQNVMTNADHIRNMTDKELAEFFCPETPRNYPWFHPIGKTNCGNAPCRRCMTKWLKQPSEGE